MEVFVFAVESEELPVEFFEADEISFFDHELFAVVYYEICCGFVVGVPNV